MSDRLSVLIAPPGKASKPPFHLPASDQGLGSLEPIAYPHLL
jgi:hypothetical protein